MNRIEHLRRLAAGVAAALLGGTATAGMHQICYEGPTQPRGTTFVSTGIYGCATDSGFCRITPQSASMATRLAAPLNQGVQSAGTFAFFDFTTSNGAGTFRAKVEFFDSNSVKQAERTCTVKAAGVFNGVTHGAASPRAVLTGFTTDVSGRVTTGVWRLQSTQLGAMTRLLVQAPGDFVAVGGGAAGVETPGAVIVESMAGQRKLGDTRSWNATTSEAGGLAAPHLTTGYVIGMHIEGLDAAALAGLVQSIEASTAPAILAAPALRLFAGSAAPVVLGGGARGVADASNAPRDLIGQFLTRVAPAYAKGIDTCGFSCPRISWVAGWDGASKDHVISHPGAINMQVLTLPATLTVDGMTFDVRSTSVSATSAVAAHPAVDVGGLRGDYALTGIGASVGANTWGNLLWKLEPRADLGGASVASKDHVVASPASITGYAIGIKLVPPGTP